MNVSNSLVYGGSLQCGSDEVATGRLLLPSYPTNQVDGVESWIDTVLDPESPVLFLDTDGHTDAAECSVGGQVCNRFEAKLVAKLVMKLREVAIFTKL